MLLDDPLCQRQADSGALGVQIEPVEELEDPVLIRGLDSPAVVADVEDRVTVILSLLAL